MKRVLDEAKAGLAIVRSGRFAPPPKEARWRRVAYTFGVVIALFRAMWRDGDMRKSYLRVLIPQLLITTVFGIAYVVQEHTINWRISRNYKLENGELVPVAEKVLEDAGATATSIIAFIIALYTALTVIEWIVIAISRQHHDALSARLSKLVGVPPEEEIANPRLSVDVKWMFTKLKRRIQGGLLLIACALPAVILLGIMLAPAAGIAAEVIDDSVANAILWLPNIAVFALTGYWLGVFVLGKTAHAWRNESAPDWLPVRWIEEKSQRFPRLLAPFRIWTRVVRRMMGVVNRPAHLVEQCSWETVGLVGVRVISSVPGLYLAVRPIIPVASTVILAVRAPESLSGMPVSLALAEKTD